MVFVPYCWACATSGSATRQRTLYRENILSRENIFCVSQRNATACCAYRPTFICSLSILLLLLLTLLLTALALKKPCRVALNKPSSIRDSFVRSQ